MTQCLWLSHKENSVVVCFVWWCFFIQDIIFEAIIILNFLCVFRRTGGCSRGREWFHPRKWMTGPCGRRNLSPNSSWSWTFFTCGQGLRKHCRIHALLQWLVTTMMGATHWIWKVLTPEFQFHDRVDLSKETCQQLFSVYVDKMTVTEQIADQIEMATRGQAKNPSWHEARFGRLTSSQFGSVMSQKPVTPSDNLVKSIMGFCPTLKRQLPGGARWKKLQQDANISM
jgi:hypothetical protein